VPRSCSICIHPERAAIDKALASGAPKSETSALFRVSPDAVDRHFAAHLPARLVKAADAKEVAQADDLLSQVRDLQARALSILDQAEEAGDLKVALAAIREARGNLELLAKLLGQLQQEGTVNVLIAPEWLQVRAVLLQALQPYHDAKYAVAGALARLESAGG
jgi:hypothetical protein